MSELYGIPGGCDKFYQNDDSVRYYPNVVVYGVPTEWTVPLPPPTVPVVLPQGWSVPYYTPSHLGDLIETVRQRIIQLTAERDVLNTEIETLEKMLVAAEGK